MIMFGYTKPEGLLIGLQRSDKKYTYLHWSEEDGLFMLSWFHSMIVGCYEDTSGIGPTMLVEWGKND